LKKLAQPFWAQSWQMQPHATLDGVIFLTFVSDAIIHKNDLLHCSKNRA